MGFQKILGALERLREEAHRLIRSIVPSRTDSSSSTIEITGLFGTLASILASRLALITPLKPLRIGRIWAQVRKVCMHVGGAEIAPRDEETSALV